MKSEKDTGALYKALFEGESEPDAELDLLKSELSSRIARSKRGLPKSIEELIRDRLSSEDGGSADRSSKTGNTEFLDFDTLSDDEFFDTDDCATHSLPEFRGLGGRRLPDYPLEQTVVDGKARAIARSATLYADAQAACLANESEASAYFGFWIQPRTDVPFHKAVVTAHLIGSSRRTDSGDGSAGNSLSLEAGSFVVATGRTRPGYAPIATRRTVPTHAPGSRTGSIPTSFSIEFQTQLNTFHYIFLGAHAQATASYSRDCDKLFEMIGRGAGAGLEQEHRELEVNTARATVNLAVCAFDVRYEPLVLPEYLERRRLENMRDELLEAIDALRNR
jgi:hypothetical protein